MKNQSRKVENWEKNCIRKKILFYRNKEVKKPSYIYNETVEK